MGYPVFLEYANDCDVLCAGAVRKFPVGETPKFAYVRFSGPRHCGTPPCVGLPLPPNDSYFHMEQDPVDSCKWEFDDGLWNVVWTPGKPADQHSYLDLTHVPSGKKYFTTNPNSLGTCVEIFVNHEVCGPNGCAFGGTGEVALQAEPYQILFDYGFYPIENFYVSKLFIPPTTRVYTFKHPGASVKFWIELED